MSKINFKSLTFLIKNMGSVAVLLCGLTTLTFNVFVIHKNKKYKIKCKEKEEQQIDIRDKINNSVKQYLMKYMSDVQVIHQLSNLNWVVVGKVKHLYAYPLISGNKYEVDECEINFNGMHVIKNNMKVKWDKSFITFDDITKHVINSKIYPSLSEVSLFVEENCIILQAPGMPYLCKELRGKEIVICDYNNGTPATPKLICIDCGNEIAQWLTKFLKGKDSIVRLGYITNPLKVIQTFWHHWTKDCILYGSPTQDNNNMGTFVDILNSILVTNVPYESMSNQLQEFQQSVKYCPNIVILTSNYYMDKVWEWIKIGNVVIKNILPLKNKSRHDEMNMPQYMKYFAFKINYKLQLPGRIKVNDDVYIHFSQ